MDVLDARILEGRYAADTAGADKGDLGPVAWSADGWSLLAGGSYAAGGWSPIRRWSEGGRGPFEELRVATKAVLALRALPDGRLTLGAGVRVALLDAGGKPLWERPNAAADHRAQVAPIH